MTDAARIYDSFFGSMIEEWKKDNTGKEGDRVKIVKGEHAGETGVVAEILPGYGYAVNLDKRLLFHTHEVAIEGHQ